MIGLCRTLSCLAVVAVMGVGATGCDEESSPNEVTGQEAADKIKEAAKTTGQYVSQEAKEMYAAMKTNFEKAGKEVDELIEKAKDESSEQWKSLKARMVKAREATNEKLGQLKDASKEQWEDAKKEFDDAYEKLKKAYQDALDYMKGEEVK